MEVKSGAQRMDHMCWRQRISSVPFRELNIYIYIGRCIMDLYSLLMANDMMLVNMSFYFTDIM